jgi:hypothetical protein
MKIKRLTCLLIVLLCVLLPIGNLAAAVLQTVDWWVIGGGGGHAESGIYALDGTIGQPVVGTGSAGTYEVCSGFWCGVSPGGPLNLPLILR